jgi:hypothetical protein
MSCPRICRHKELTQCWVNWAMWNQRQRWILLQQMINQLRHHYPFIWTPTIQPRTQKPCTKARCLITTRDTHTKKAKTTESPGWPTIFPEPSWTTNQTRCHTDAINAFYSNNWSICNSFAAWSQITRLRKQKRTQRYHSQPQNKQPKTQIKPDYYSAWHADRHASATVRFIRAR